MKPGVYVETTIVSYLAARPSREPFLLGCQRLTRLWWRERRREYELFTSDTVIAEAGRGEAQMIRKRVRLLKNLGHLAATDEITALAEQLLVRGIVPRKAEGDAMHIAFAASYGIEYLLTWNCTHLANPHVQARVARVVVEAGFDMPAIVTPMQLYPLSP